MKSSFLNYFVMALVVIGLTSCGGSEETPVAPTMSVPENPVTAEAGSQQLTVTATGEWTIDKPDDWITISALSGNGDRTLTMTYDRNRGEDRTATIYLRNSAGTATLDFTQAAAEIISATSRISWMELPGTNANDEAYGFFYHKMEIGSTETRNYSYYYDYENLVSIWVAYPLCSWNIGNSTNRTDAWGLDPNIPADKQPVLASGFSNGNNGWYSRGHQIPSADRYTSYSANAATFYYTNMTPQLNDKFNSSIWADLEGKVRSWSKSSQTDTLYVVTGCVVDGSPYYALDNNGKHVTVPTHYYKALLRYSKTASVGHSGYMGAAFWFEHKDYSEGSAGKTHALSISDLEEKLGYELFVNLPDAVGDATAQTIKDENPADVSWWGLR